MCAKWCHWVIEKTRMSRTSNANAAADVSATATRTAGGNSWSPVPVLESVCRRGRIGATRCRQWPPVSGTKRTGNSCRVLMVPSAALSMRNSC